jgi:hypothetical protein
MKLNIIGIGLYGTYIILMQNDSSHFLNILLETLSKQQHLNCIFFLLVGYLYIKSIPIIAFIFDII